jgi:hypothetical protein
LVLDPTAGLTPPDTPLNAEVGSFSLSFMIFSFDLLDDLREKVIKDKLFHPTSAIRAG